MSFDRLLIRKRVYPGVRQGRIAATFDVEVDGRYTIVLKNSICPTEQTRPAGCRPLGSTCIERSSIGWGGRSSPETGSPEFFNTIRP